MTWFTENIFREDKEIVEHEQRAYDAQGADWNNEVFPPIRADPRPGLLRPAHRAAAHVDAFRSRKLPRPAERSPVRPSCWWCMIRPCFAGSPALGIEGAIAPEQSSVVPRVHRLILFRISTMGNLMAVDIDLACFARLLG